MKLGPQYYSTSAAVRMKNLDGGNPLQGLPGATQSFVGRTLGASHPYQVFSPGADPAASAGLGSLNGLGSLGAPSPAFGQAALGQPALGQPALSQPGLGAQQQVNPAQVMMALMQMMMQLVSGMMQQQQQPQLR